VPGQAGSADLGAPAAGLRVRILRDDGTEAAESEVGEIAVSGDSVGRLLRDDGSMAPVAELRTGDLGFWRAGSLHVAGRTKDLIILRGQNVYPSDIEAAALQASSAVAPGGVAALGIAHGGTQELVVMVELERRIRLGTDEREQLKRTISEGVAHASGHVPADVQVWPFGALPRTSSGKIQRSAAAALYATAAQGGQAETEGV
jgi:acyl-CoA synthetase (AMP-forming)/AMP-acid ligase II